MEIIDLDVFVPPVRRAKIGGREFVVKNLVDLPYKDFLTVISLEERLKLVATEDERMKIVATQIAMVCEGLTADEVLKLPLRQIGTLLAFVMQANVQDTPVPFVNAGSSSRPS